MYTKNFSFVMRRLRDSNPRYSFPYTHFPGVLLQPLGQVSIIKGGKNNGFLLAENNFCVVCCNRGYLFQRNIFNIRYFFGNELYITTLISFAPVRNGCEVRRVRFQYNML